jgi:ATP-dependent Zn protease
MITLAEILLLHLRDEQLGEDVDLHNIARKTNYYSGSDLKGEFFCIFSANSLTNQFILC